MNPLILQTLEAYFERFPYHHKVIGFDSETTGFRNSDRIIELGAYGFEFDGFDLKPIEFQTLINPEMHIPEKITEITGITDEMVKDAPLDHEVYPQFADFIKDATILIGHNAQFDRRLITSNFFRVGVDLGDFEDRIKCTLVKAKKSGLVLPSLQLSSIAEHFGYKNENAHRAKDDALTALFVWGKLALQD